MNSKEHFRSGCLHHPFLKVLNSNIMKHFLPLLCTLSLLLHEQCLGVVYVVYATEPSGIMLSPTQSSKPNTVTIKSGQRIQLTGMYDQEVVKWYGEGLPAEGSPFFYTFVAPVNTGSENSTLIYKANNSDENAIIVTVLPAQGVMDPIISASTFCVLNPLLTASRCSGVVKWYKKQGNGLWEPYVRVPIPGAEGNSYQITAGGNYCATCNVEGVESFGSETISSSGVQPVISVSSPQPNTNICMWSDRTVQASGAGTEAGPITWFEKVGNDPATAIGSGYTRDVTITNLNTSYYAQLAVSGCPTKTSNTFTFTVQEPAVLSNAGERSFTAHVQGMNILTDDNCQLIAGFGAGLNNDGVNLMLGKRLTAKVTKDVSVQLYNGQPYLQRHFDFEPEITSEGVGAFTPLRWYLHKPILMLSML
jgi:hypothetical protein